MGIGQETKWCLVNIWNVGRWNDGTTRAWITICVSLSLSLYLSLSLSLSIFLYLPLYNVYIYIYIWYNPRMNAMAPTRSRCTACTGLGGIQTGSYQTESYQKGRFIPPKPILSYILFWSRLYASDGPCRARASWPRAAPKNISTIIEVIGNRFIKWFCIITIYFSIIIINVFYMFINLVIYIITFVAHVLEREYGFNVSLRRL